MKKKASSLKGDKNTVEADVYEASKLNNYERRLLELYGATFFQGIGIEEFKLSDIVNKRKVKTEPAAGPSKKACLRPEINIHNSIKDHEYTNNKRSKIQKMSKLELYQESLACLQDIRDSFTAGLQDIRDSITNGMNLIALSLDNLNDTIRNFE